MGSRYPARQRTQPQEWFKAQAHVARAPGHVEPQTYEEALASPEAAEWKLAMNEKLPSLRASDTWTLEKRPAGVKPIPVESGCSRSRGMQLALLSKASGRGLHAKREHEVFAQVRQHPHL